MKISSFYVIGILGGMAGGLVFGITMHLMGMMPMIAKMAGSESVAVGWFIHIIISAVIGAFYVWWFGKQTSSYGRGILFGMIHGMIWWIIGALTIMPLILGMAVQYSEALSEMSLMSLMGHLIYGVILGLIYYQLTKTKVPIKA